MGRTVSTGPAISVGPMMGMSGIAPDTNLEAGPGITYQGDVIPDVRYVVQGGSAGIASIRGHLDTPYVLLADYVPAASAATPVNIAAAQATVSGTPMTLVSAASSGITPNVPFYQYSTGTLLTSAVTLDFGFSTLNVTSGSKPPTVVAGTIGLYSQGQWLVIGNVGNAGGTIPLITQVTAVGTTTITLANAALATNSTAPVGQGNILDTVSLGNPATASLPYLAAGVAAIFNPLEGAGRGVGINCNTGATGGVFTVRGYDVYGQFMSEAITAVANTTVYGKKAFHHIMSVTPAVTDAGHTYSVGTSDVFGFALRADKWEYLNLYVAGAFLSVSTGWTAADVTSPATTTTGDVRGTIQVGTRGSLGSGAAGGPITGSQRLALFGSIPAYNLIAATPANPAPMYGVTPA